MNNDVLTYFKVDEVMKNVYRIFEPTLNVYIYVVVGSQKTLVFDTGFGLMDIKQVVEKITTVPYVVVASHGHIDHAAGIPRFDKVYMHEDDIDLAMDHTSKEFRSYGILHGGNKGIDYDSNDEENYRNSGLGNVITFSDDFNINLGNKHVEIIHIPGHTKGSVAAWIPEDKLLLAGDSINRNVWMFLTESQSLFQLYKSLGKLSNLPVEIILTGHMNDVQHRDLLLDQLHALEALDISGSEHVTYKGFEDFDIYEYILYKDEPNQTKICYSPDKL